MAVVGRSPSHAPANPLSFRDETQQHLQAWALVNEFCWHWLAVFCIEYRNTNAAACGSPSKVSNFVLLLTTGVARRGVDSCNAGLYEFCPKASSSIPPMRWASPPKKKASVITGAGRHGNRGDRRWNDHNENESSLDDGTY